MSDIAAIEAASDGLVRASRRPRFANTDVFLPVGILILAVFLAFAIAPGLLAPHSPIKLDITNQNLSPRPGHWLGTDQFGRDILSRIIYGTRTSLGMAFAVVLIGAAVGTLVGAVAGFLGGWVDEVLMRIVDVFLSLPSFILAMALAAALGRGVVSLTVALAIVWWPGYARLIRGMVMSIGERLHVESARALGVSRSQIVLRHILPFTYTQLNVRITQDVGYALVAVASLSFIGLGAQPPSSEWGLMLSDARQYILQAWWYPLFPGLAIMLLTVGLAMIGDAFADRLGAGDDVLEGYIDEVVLDVRGLRTHIGDRQPVVRAVDGVSFQLHRGRTLAIVGESGSGKSMTALSITRLLPTASARIVGGSIEFDGTDLIAASDEHMRQVRGNRIAIMFQDPMTALNPALRVGRQVMEPLLVHRVMDRQGARLRALDLLGRTHLPDPAAVFEAYPHQLSGGMRQRVVLAMALVCEPDILIADEPTTALDVTTQEQIVDLLREIQETTRLSLILISHDLGVVARIADEVLVVYAGRSAEHGAVRDVFRSPSHPYTRGLLESVDLRQYRPRERLDSIPGVPPRLDDVPPGCPFHPRCKHAEPQCAELVPELSRPPGAPTVAACLVAQDGRLPAWDRQHRQAAVR